MVFCNLLGVRILLIFNQVTILILIDGFLQLIIHYLPLFYGKVTILILIDGFLQYIDEDRIELSDNSHNPYFNRWFSAISTVEKLISMISNVTILILIDGFLQYTRFCTNDDWDFVTILILIDGFLQ